MTTPLPLSYCLQAGVLLQEIFKCTVFFFGGGLESE